MIQQILQIYIYVIIIDIIMSYIPNLRGQKWADGLHKIADVSQKPIRDLLPRDIPLDPSPMIVILICQLLMYLL